MNSCTFCGRVVFDAEMRTTNGGAELCRLRIASDTGWGDNKKTHWLDCVIFGKRGASLAQYLKKGQQVTVIGDLEPPRTYDKDGEVRVAQSLVVREIALQGAMGSAQNDQTQQRPPAAASSHVDRNAAQKDFDDDIPF